MPNTVHRLSQPHAPPSAFVRASPLPQAPAHPTVTTSVGADVLGSTDGGLLIGPAVGVLVVGTALVSPLGTPVGTTDGVPLLGATVEPSSKHIGVPVPSCGAQWSPAQHDTSRQLSPAVFRHPVISDGELVGRGVDGAPVGFPVGRLVAGAKEGLSVGTLVGLLVGLIVVGREGTKVGATVGIPVPGAFVGNAVGDGIEGLAVGTSVDGGRVPPSHTQP